MRETALQTPKAVKKKGEKELKAPEQKIKRFSAVQRTQVVPLQVSTVEQISTCSQWRTPHWSSCMCPEGSCRSRVLAGIGTHGEKPM